MADREIKTNVTIKAETKGFEQAQAKADAFNQSVSGALKDQTKGFAEAAKASAAFTQVLGRMKESFGGSTDELKKYLEEAIDKFQTLGGMKFTDVKKSLEEMRENLEETVKAQLAVESTMTHMTDKTGVAYLKLQRTYKGLDNQAKELRKGISQMDMAYRKQRIESDKEEAKEKKRQGQAKQHGFLTGFLQAAMPSAVAPWLQRGEGMKAQAAGMLAGGIARRGGRMLQGLAAAPFTGVAGLQQAISVLPGGGILGGLMGTSAGYAQQALGWQRQRLAASAYIGGPRGNLGGMEAGLAATKAGLTKAREPVAARMHEATRRGRGIIALGERFGLKGAGTETAKAMIAAREERVTNIFAMNPEIRRLKAQETAQTTALARARAGGEWGLRGMGREFGLGRQETLQAAAAIQRAGGGVYQGGGEQERFMRTALAAQTRFDVGAGVSGAFLRGSRRGGLAGERGEGSKALVGAIGDAMKLGLEGSEINKYLEDIAKGIERFETTGIPFNRISLKSMALEISKSGITGTRGAVIAEGIQNYLTGMGTRGVTGGMDLFMLQKMGGFKGGGAQDYRDSLIRMEQMKTELAEKGIGGVTAGSKLGEGLKDILRMGGGGVSGEGFLQTQLGAMGAQVSATEARLLRKKLGGEALTPEEQGWADMEDKRRRSEGRKRAAGLGSPEQFAAAASQLTDQLGPNLKAQTDIQAKQLETGEKMIGVVHKLELSAANAADAFANLAGKKGSVIDIVASKFLDLTTFLDKVTGAMAFGQNLGQALVTTSSGLGS